MISTLLRKNLKQLGKQSVAMYSTGSSATSQVPRRPVGAFRGAIAGFVIGSGLSLYFSYYYLFYYPSDANSLLIEDVIILTESVSRIQKRVENLEDKVNSNQK